MNNFLQFLENFGKDHNHLSLEVQSKKREEQVAVYHPKKKERKGKELLGQEFKMFKLWL